MKCDAIELHLAGESSEQDSVNDSIAEHLAACPGCRTFAQRLEQMDVALSKTVKAPALGHDFNLKLQQRIQAQRTLSPEYIAQRKRELQAEYEAGLKRLQPWSLPLALTIHNVRSAVLIALVGFIAWLSLPTLTNVVARYVSSGPLQYLLPSILITFLLIGIGFAIGFPHRVKRLGRTFLSRA
jgi:hypothetical protein